MSQRIGNQSMRYSIRALIAVMTVVAIYLGYRLSTPVRQRDAVTTLEDRGGTVAYQPGKQNALTRLLGPAYGGVVDYADLFGADVGDEELEYLTALDDITQLRLSGTKITDEGLKYIRHLTQLEWLDLSSTRVTSDAMVNLEALDSLCRLHLTDTDVGDRGIASISGLQGVDMLDLSGTQVTDVGVAHLRRMENLTALHLGGTKCTDDSVTSIAAIPNLETLTLYGATQISPAGITRLLELKPALQVFPRSLVSIAAAASADEPDQSGLGDVLPPDGNGPVSDR